MNKRLFHFLVLLFATLSGISTSSANLSENTLSSVIQLKTDIKTGTAVFISNDGYLLTNYHVISNTNNISVCTQEDIKSDSICVASAVVIAEDKELDIALLKIETDQKNLYHLELGNSDDLIIGDEIQVLGYPDNGGNSLTITNGTISGWINNGGLIKVDASLSSGASGGATINKEEKIVGINVAVQIGDYANSGIVIPINIVKTWLTSAGYGDLKLYGTTVQELEESWASLGALVQEYREQAKTQQVKIDMINEQYDKKRVEQKTTYDEALAELSKDYNELSQEIHDTIDYVEAYYRGGPAKDAALEDLNNDLEELEQNYEESKISYAKTYENNLEIIDELEKEEMARQGIADYNVRIAQVQTVMQKIKDEIARLKRLPPKQSEPSETEETNITIPIFNDLPLDHKNKAAIEYLSSREIVNGYPTGEFKPENSVNRAELLKLLIEASVENFNSASYKTNCFSDIGSEDWFTPYVCYAKEKKWVNGYSDGTFKPGQAVSRTEAVKIVLESFDINPPIRVTTISYDDVGFEDWFAPYLQIAYEKNYLEETSGNFHPHNYMSRAGVSEIIYRVMRSFGK